MRNAEIIIKAEVDAQDVEAEVSAEMIGLLPRYAVGVSFGPLHADAREVDPQLHVESLEDIESQAWM
jgi:hypothetical protein